MKLIKFVSVIATMALLAGIPFVVSANSNLAIKGKRSTIFCAQEETLTETHAALNQTIKTGLFVPDLKKGVVAPIGTVSAPIILEHGAYYSVCVTIVEK